MTADTTPVALTLLTATRGAVSKKLSADTHGRPIRDPAHTLGITAGMVEHIVVHGLVGLRTLLASVTHQQALIHGVPRHSQLGDRFQLVVAEKFTEAPGTIARTKAHCTYPDEVRLLMFDVDPDPVAPRTLPNPDDVMTQLRAVFPPFDGVGWLAVCSTSSAIQDRATSAWLRPPDGWHIYLLVTGDIERLRELARVRLWLDGTGFCKLARPNTHTGVAAILERCLIDLAVFSPERLDYVAGAITDTTAPFVQDRPPPQFHSGTVLDLAALPEVTEDGVARAQC